MTTNDINCNYLNKDINNTMKIYCKNKDLDKDKIIFQIYLVKFIPDFSIETFNISFDLLFGQTYREFYDKTRDLGLEINSQAIYIKIKDYLKFFQNIFSRYDIFDMQYGTDDIGHPDFKLVEKCNKNNIFYIELKKNSDGISSNQLNWLLKNSDKKVYYFFIKEKYN